MCGGELAKMKEQFEESEVVTVVKRSFVIELQRSPKVPLPVQSKCGDGPLVPRKLQQEVATL